MSPPDGDVAVVDPTLRRKAVALRLRELADQATERRLAARLTDTTVELSLDLCAVCLGAGDSLYLEHASELRIQRRMLEVFVTHAETGAHYRAVVKIIDEALALLRGIR